MSLAKQSILIFIASVLSACSSMPESALEHAGEEHVVSRIEEMSSRPNWLKESEPFRIENGKVMAIGMTNLPSDSNVSAGYRIAANNAKSLISHSIEQRLDFIFQNAEEGTAIDANQARYIGAEASKLTSSSIRQTKQYWEKVRSVEEDGRSVVRYRIFALVEIPEADFKSAIVDAVRRHHGMHGLSEEFAKKVDEHWNQFVNSSNVQAKVDRKAASNEEE